MTKKKINTICEIPMLRKFVKFHLHSKGYGVNRSKTMDSRYQKLKLKRLEGAGVFDF